jgi:eukaryotic-like serine/threonine-protein kinase
MAEIARIGKYEVESCLGGNMCQVCQARDVKLGRRVAIKLLPRDAGTDRRERLLAEARIFSNLRHPNLIHVYDFGEEDGRLYLVMDLLDGCTLREAMQRENIAQRRIIEIARQVASALSYVHSRNIVHRDVKPDNIFVTCAGEVKLIDFGVAKFGELQVTGAGFTLGTPYYMAPEQVRGERITPLVDVYAFGITLYELLTRVRPVNGTTVDQIFDEILNRPLDPSPLAANNVPAPLAQLVQRCTAKSPGERPQSFSEIEQCLSAQY